MLKKIDVTGGPPVSIGDLSGVGASAGGTWNKEGVILVGSPQGVFRISQSGGAAERVTKPNLPNDSSQALPHFLPDGQHFLYLSTQLRSVYAGSLDGRLKERLADGVSRAEYVPAPTPGEPGHVLYVREGTLMAQPLDSAGGRIRDWSSDARYLLYDLRDADGLFRFWVMPLDGDRKPITYELARFNLAQGQFAPSGTAPPKWIAYVSNESGANEIYVQSFPPTGRGIRVSGGGGQEPRWRADGKELFYIAPGGSVMEVDTTLEPTFSHSVPRELFKASIASGGPRAFAFHYDVTPDGKRFLLITTPQAQTTAPPPITVVLNWQTALKR